MSDQMRIAQDGSLEPDPQPLTWDGEPMFSPSTIREGLFSVNAFEQLPGQLAIDDRSWDGEPLWSASTVAELNRIEWYRFAPDQGLATSFSARSKEDAQRFAAEHFHDVPGILRGPLVIS
jgi:hypothetical protein